MLYPLKFSPILKERIWGGSNLKNEYGKEYPNNTQRYGESWELSTIEGSVSVVSNGFLAGNSLDELIEIYMGDLVGDRVYFTYGQEFPLLIKLIDSNDFLSIQVHPDDDMAKRLHHAYGKSEFWYILKGDKDSKIITGFSKEINKEQFKKIINSGNINHYLHYVPVKRDDFVYIPAGQVHALGRGVQLVEIQQASDITYRIYDWDRVDDKGIGRELHTSMAADAINFKAKPIETENFSYETNRPQLLGAFPYFSVNRLVINEQMDRDFVKLDTFRIYLCIEGELELNYSHAENVSMKKGELVLVPASLSNVVLIPKEESKVLEVFID